MKQIAIVLLYAATLASGTAHAVDKPAQASPHLELDSPLDPSRNMQIIDAIMAAAPIPPAFDLDDPVIEPSAPSLVESAWAEGNESGVAYPLTNAISLGLAYEHEEIESLTAELIEMGTAGVDYTSHKVLVRAQFHFDLID